MAEDKKHLSRRELIRGASLVAIGGQGVLKQQGTKPQVLNAVSWPDHKQAAIRGVRQALDQWKQQARFADIRIMAVSAIGGRLIGPDMTPLVQSAMAGSPPNVAGAFARTVGAAWKTWQDSVTVPGLPWYPAFAAFPGPMAPPMPNVPTPLAALASPGDSAFLPDNIAAQLRKELGGAANESGAEREIIDFAFWLASNFAVWKASAQVMLVMGKGPVPTFAPPYVPVGPVVMGDNISTPGHLAAAPGFNLPAITYFDAKKSFESKVANAFTVRLENGAAGLEGANAHLFGDVSILAGENSPVNIMVRGAEMTLSQTSAQSRGLLQKARIDLGTLQEQTISSPQTNPADRARISDLVKRVETATANMGTMKGSGRLEVMVGTVMIPIPSASFELDDKGRLSILGGTIDFKGITHSVGKGSYISPTEMRLVGWIQLQSLVVTDSILAFRAKGVTGGGRLQAFAHTFSLTYDLTGPRLKASAEAGGPDRGWQSMPFVNGAQYEAKGTRIVVSIDGSAISATVRVPTLGVRTSATRPDGKPWAEQSSSPGTFTVAVNGDVNLRPPGLASPADPLQAARQACEASARAAHVIPDVSSLLVGEARRLAEEARNKAIEALNAAMAECAKKNPSPPPMPQIPQALRVKVGNLVG